MSAAPTGDPNDMVRPLVSMVVPSYNHEKYVEGCIRSIIDQDYQNIELIIIDDGSTDGSVARIKAWLPACEKRFTRFEFRSRANRGLSATLDEALRWSQGEYFSVLPSDDVLLPGKTTRLLQAINGKADCAGIFSGCELIDHDGQVLGRIEPVARHYSFDDIILTKHVLVTPSQLIRVQHMRDIGGYPAGLYIEDWYMWLALTRTGKTLKVLPDPLVQYRQHEGSLSKNAVKMHAGRLEVLGHFKDSEWQGVAMARICVAAAIDISATSRRASLNHLIEAIRHYPGIATTGRFAGALARLAIPKPLVAWLARAKKNFQRNQRRSRRSW